MVNPDGLLEDEDLNSEVPTDQESQAGSLTPSGRRDTLTRAFGGYTQDDSSEEEGLGELMDFDERASQSGRPGIQDPRDYSDVRSQPQQVLHGIQLVDPNKGKTLYSRRGANPIKFISDPRKRQAAEEVLDAFSGPPKKRNPDHVKLKGTGWAMAQRVFSPSVEWPTKEVNNFIVKHLTLVPEQKKELECDLVQESFLKDYEKVPGYKASFKFKNKMFASMRAQRTSLVPLFKLGDALT